MWRRDVLSRSFKPRTLTQTFNCKLGTNGVSVEVNRGYLASDSLEMHRRKRGICACSHHKFEYHSNPRQRRLTLLFLTGRRTNADIRRPRIAEDMRRDHTVGQRTVDGQSAIFCRLDREGLCRRGRMVSSMFGIWMAHSRPPTDSTPASAARQGDGIGTSADRHGHSASRCVAKPPCSSCHRGARSSRTEHSGQQRIAESHGSSRNRDAGSNSGACSNGGTCASRVERSDSNRECIAESPDSNRHRRAGGSSRIERSNRQRTAKPSRSSCHRNACPNDAARSSCDRDARSTGGACASRIEHSDSNR